MYPDGRASVLVADLKCRQCRGTAAVYVKLSVLFHVPAPWYWSLPKEVENMLLQEILLRSSSTLAEDHRAPPSYLTLKSASFSHQNTHPHTIHWSLPHKYEYIAHHSLVSGHFFPLLNLPPSSQLSHPLSFSVQ